MTEKIHVNDLKIYLSRFLLHGVPQICQAMSFPFQMVPTKSVWRISQWAPVMISVISSHASTFVASGNSYLFHSLFSLYDQISRRGRVIRGGEQLLTMSWKYVLSHHMLFMQERRFYLCFFLPLAAWFLGMRSIAEQRKLAEDAWASGSECSYTLDLTAVKNLCIS